MDTHGSGLTTQGSIHSELLHIGLHISRGSVSEGRELRSTRDGSPGADRTEVSSLPACCCDHHQPNLMRSIGPVNGAESITLRMH